MTGDGRVSRRRVLEGAGAAVASALAGCAVRSESSAQASTNSSTRNGGQNQNFRSLDPAAYADRFETVVNIAAEGADNTGNEPVNDVLERVWDDDTLIVFPPGRYLFNRQLRRTNSRNVGVIGQGAILTHAPVRGIHRHRVTDGEFYGRARFFRIGVEYSPHEGDFVFGGFVVDWTGENAGMQLLNHHTEGQSEIRNVTFRGIHSLGCEGAFRVNPMASDASALVQNVDMRAGGKHYANTINTREGRDGESWATSGLTTHPEKDGVLRVDNVLCGGWPDNGLYVRGGSGKEVITNCTAANSRVSNIRVGGEGSVISNCTVIIDRGLNEQFDGGQVAIRLDKGTPTLQNSRIVVKKELETWAVHARRVDEAVIRDCDFTLSEGVRGIFCSPTAGPTRIENVRFHTPGWEGAGQAVVDPAGNAVARGLTDDGTPV